MLLTPGAKVLFAIGVFAFALLLVGQVVSGDQTMAVLLMFMVAAGVAAGVAIAAGSRAPETSPAAAAVPAGAGPPSLTPVEPSHSPRGGGWPLLGAAAMALLLLSFVATPLLAAAAIVVGIVAAVGWMVSAAGDHSGHEPNLLPVGIPVLGLFTIFSLMFCLSRVLLAVPDWGSTVVALAVALTIISTATFLAVKPQLQARTLATILGVAGMLLLTVGLIAAGVGKRSEPETAASKAGPVKVDAQNLKFDKAVIDLEAGVPAEINFDNKDAGVPHNMAFYTDSSAANDLFVGGVVVGVNKIDYRFTAPPPGDYYFRCDIHTFMQGHVKVS